MDGLKGKASFLYPAAICHLSTFISLWVFFNFSDRNFVREILSKFNKNKLVLTRHLENAKISNLSYSKF